MGGSPAANIGECLGDNASDCDVFYEENCEYKGSDTGLSPDDGAMKNEEECQQFCQIFQDYGCQYWTFQRTKLSCTLLSSQERTCSGLR